MKNLIIFLFFIVNAAGLWAQQSLEWTMAFLDARTEAALSFSQPISMKDGDSFTLYIRNAAPCYCSIIVQDSEQTLQVLQNRYLSSGEEQQFPVTITPPAGSENFYIIMSLTEQRDLNAKISAYQKSAPDQGPSRYSRDLIQEVFKIRRSLSSLKESAEKPVFMGGAFRGTAKPEGLEFSGAAAYVKTITINH